MKIKLLFLASGLFLLGCNRHVSINDSYIQFFDSANYGGLSLTVVPTTGKVIIRNHGDIQDLSNVHSDSKDNDNFNDRASSVIYCLPKGWSVILFENADYGGDRYTLIGTGKTEKISNLRDVSPPFARRTSSLRWVQN